MGSTTKSGRTRNRRAIAQNQPPSGFPSLLSLELTTQVGPTENVLLVACNGIIGWPGPLSAVGNRVKIKHLTAGTIVEGTLTVDDATHVRIVYDTMPADGVEYIMVPWQTTCRGPNGEWFAPSIWQPRSP